MTSDADDGPAAEAPARVERLCAQFHAERADPTAAEWARARFVRDKALGFAADNGAVAWLVEVAALLDGVDAATRSRATTATNADPDRDARYRRSLLHPTIPDPADRERIEQILRDSRLRPLDPAVSPEAQALHDARTVYAVLPTTPVALAAQRMRTDGVSLAELARSETDVLDTLSADGLFYDPRARDRYRRWAEAARELWNCVSTAAEDPDVRTLLGRLPVGGAPDDARRIMVENIAASGDVTDLRVRHALSVVPRHLFTPPETPLERAYADRAAVVTKRDSDGRAWSSVSAPWLQARMIEQSGLRAGSRVLEIGSGGYNAALLAEVVGPTGRVVSVDIDADVVDRARARLEATGYGDRIQVVHADAAHRVCPPGEQVDAVLVTVGAWDVAPAWIDQLTDDGVLVVPLRMNGMTRSIAFRRAPDHLYSTSVVVCGFVPMQGDDAHTEHKMQIPIAGADDRHLTLEFDSQPEADAASTTARLRNVLDGESTTTWTGVTVGGMESLSDLFLRCATLLPGYCALTVDDGVDLAAVPVRSWPHGVVRGAGLAYLVSRPDDDLTELGACARSHGDDSGTTGSVGAVEAADAAADLCQQIREWGRSRSAEPTFTYWPAATVPDTPQAARLAKRHGTLLVTWPGDDATDSRVGAP